MQGRPFEFYNWMINIDLLSESTASQYAYISIPEISDHYSKNTGRKIDIYTFTMKHIDDLTMISHKYRNGIYRNVGQKGHGNNAAAIAKYEKYIRYLHNPHDPHFSPAGRGKSSQSRDYPDAVELRTALAARNKTIAELTADCDRLSVIARRVVGERDQWEAKARSSQVEIARLQGRRRQRTPQ